MPSLPSSLDHLWRDIEALDQAPAHRRVDDIHPLDMYIGIDHGRARELVLISDAVSPDVAKRYRAFEVTATVRTDGRHALSVRLRRQELARLFAHLCDDLVDASRTCAKPDAVRFVVERIARWEQLLSRERDGLLDDAALRGLVAELMFLRDIAIPAKGKAEGLHSWRGPLGAPHDFQFAALSVEVKSVTETLIASISSAEQLDAGGEPLFLSAFRLHATGESGEGTFSAAALVDSLRRRLADDAPVAAEFEDKLSLAGYTDAREYEARQFTVKDIRHFEISALFPRIVPSMLAQGILSVSYGLDLRHCESFRCASVL